MLNIRSDLKSEVELKKILFYMLLLISLVFSKMRVDEFTGDTIYYTNYNRIVTNISTSLDIALYNYSNKEYYLDICFIPWGANAFAIPKGFPIRFKFKNGEQLEIVAGQSVVSSVGGGRNGNRASRVIGVTQRYIITREQLKQLKQYNIDIIRIYGTEGYYQNKIKRLNSKLINKMVGELGI